jgi:anti-anti-sigma factor
VLVDLSNLLYLTSAGFRALLMATDEAEQRSAWFALCGMTATVRDLFEMGGLASVFTIFDSRREAVASRA